MRKSDYTILLVDDEPDIVEIMSFHLEQEGYNVFSAPNGKEGIELALKCQPHLIMLDMMMPEIDGVETCERIRSIEQLKNTAIAFLTARSEDYSQIAGFRAGADDYISKPVNLKVLSHRIKALLQRYGNNKSKTDAEIPDLKKQYGNLVIDEEKHLIIIDGREINLPKKEFKLLLLLSSKPGKVFTRDIILSHIWGNEVIVGGRTIDEHIRNIREQIGNHRIITYKGIVYKYVE